MTHPTTTLKDLLRQRAYDHPKNPLLISKDGRFTYGDFQQEVYRVANAFLRLGVCKGDKVAVLLSNCPEFLLAVFAAAEIGAVFVPINTAFSADEVGYVLDHADSGCLITERSYLALIDRVRDRCPQLKRVIALGKKSEPGCFGWDELLHGASDKAPAIAVQADDLVSITYTSGTTDRPKGVMLTQFTYAFAPQKRAEALGWNERDRALVMLPLFHVNALCHIALAMISVGGSLVLREKFSASHFWDEVREYGVTTSSLMRTIPTILLNQPERSDDSQNPLRLAVALLPPDLHLRFEQRFDLTVVGSYSLTEDILSVLGPTAKTKRKLGSCGLPAAPEAHRLRITDEAGNDLPPGKLGEIVKQSPAVMRGYYKNPAATAEALREGWLYTGDLGYIDDDGFLYFIDRKKDMIKRGDENVSAEEVERVLNSHPQIAESAVVGVADPIRQEEIKACVVLKPPATAETVSPEAIWSFCRERLAAFKVPRYIEYHDSLPKTSSVKVQKSLLREEAKAGPHAVFDRQAPKES
ncbi:MAG TPA: AMP-binding protein [Candidatus Binatia bacterium]|jgi:acyl-CoA synthetase (AMP-forming)/AMP-acid ligase II